MKATVINSNYSYSFQQLLATAILSNNKKASVINSENSYAFQQLL